MATSKHCWQTRPAREVIESAFDINMSHVGGLSREIWLNSIIDTIEQLNRGDEDFTAHRHGSGGACGDVNVVNGAGLTAYGQWIAHRLCVSAYGYALYPIERTPKPGYIYVVRMGAFCKIGKTRHPEDRLQSIFGVKPPVPAAYSALVYTRDASGLEAALHRYFKSQQTNGEWFALSDEDVEYIKTLAVQV